MRHEFCSYHPCKNVDILFVLVILTEVPFLLPKQKKRLKGRRGGGGQGGRGRGQGEGGENIKDQRILSLQLL